MAELEDAAVSKAVGRKAVQVRVLLWRPFGRVAQQQRRTLEVGNSAGANPAAATISVGRLIGKASDLKHHACQFESDPIDHSSGRLAQQQRHMLQVHDSLGANPRPATIWITNQGSPWRALLKLWCLRACVASTPLSATWMINRGSLGARWKRDGTQLGYSGQHAGHPPLGY